MSVGNLTAAWAAARVENSVALCQLNFDFTFKKVLPPIEYQPVGKALTFQRRANAEDGAAHRLARKLGWLFENIIPDTPQLLKAYGLRVCEILNEPGINPTGTTADGCFQSFVGADCTSLWAAATSGIPALGVHLLSCMLARAWDAKTATAIWVELIEERQAAIFNGIGKDHVVSETSITAARQEYSRQELANWDASARAWLARADQTHIRQRDQFLIIAKNVNVTTGSSRKPYPNVIEAWTSAMQCLERHLCGISQKISDGGIMYAISAWHLFPDIVHFSSKVQNVQFHDRLFHKPATITLGLNEVATSKDNCGVHWSLSLSHLRYYGTNDNVEAEEDRSRVDISRLLVVALGAVLDSWQIPPARQLDTIRWIHGLWSYLERDMSSNKYSLPLLEATSWLSPLAKAASHVLSWPADDAENYKDLLQHGERWAQSFLLDEGYRGNNRLQPYFGLCNRSVISSLQQPSDIDAGVEYLRQIAARMCLKDGEALICYSRHRKGEVEYWEYCSAIPHMVASSDGSLFPTHARWIKIGSTSTTSIRVDDPTRIPMLKSGFKNDFDLESRIKAIKDQGESCYELTPPGPIYQRSEYHGKSILQDLIWEHPPATFSRLCTSTSTCLAPDRDVPCSCFVPYPANNSDQEEKLEHAYISFKRQGYFNQNFISFELYVNTDAKQARRAGIYENTFWDRKEISPLESLGLIQQEKLSQSLIWDYLRSFASIDYPHMEESLAGKLLTSTIQPPQEWLTSLELLGAVSVIYDGLKGATISLGAVEYPLISTSWVACVGHERGTAKILDKMDRATTFACIVMLHTGGTDLHPDDLEEVMAMSSDNSIYVAGSLLADPHEVVNGTVVRHIVGNIGYAGFNLMISPPGDLIVNQPKNELRVIRRESYDFKREDSFERTSLHLKFTQGRFPILSANSDTIDQDIFHLQSVVQLWDNGQHVADLDLLKIESVRVDRLSLDCRCAEPMLDYGDEDIRSLDSWHDILRPPHRVCVVRGHDNWAARLAATVVLSQLDRIHTIAILGPEKLCWKCLVEYYQDPEPHLPQILID